MADEIGGALRWVAGIGLLVYAAVALSHHHGSTASPLLPAVVGAFLLIRGFIKDHR